MPLPVRQVGAKENRLVADGQRKSLSRAQMARCRWAYFRRALFRRGARKTMVHSTQKIRARAAHELIVMIGSEARSAAGRRWVCLGAAAEAMTAGLSSASPTRY